MTLAVESYLQGLDAHLAGVPNVTARILLLEGERRRVDRLEQALSEWAACGRDVRPQPTRFSSFDLALLHGALSVRLQGARVESAFT